MKLVVIFAGGGAGAVVRYILSQLVSRQFSSGFPWGTMAVNLIGCFLIGLLYELSTYRIISPEIRNLVFVGFLGGFTTFSTYSLESMTLLRSGQTVYAIGNILISTVMGLILVIAGARLTAVIVKQGGL